MSEFRTPPGTEQMVQHARNNRRRNQWGLVSATAFLVANTVSFFITHSLPAVMTGAGMIVGLLAVGATLNMLFGATGRAPRRLLRAAAGRR